MAQHLKTWIFAAFSAVALLLPGSVKAQQALESTFEPRWAHEVHYGSLIGSSDSEIQAGASLQYIGTYRIKRYLGIGGGIGAQSYQFNSGYSYFPFWAVCKLYDPSQTGVQPYLQLAAGYGAALNRKDDETLLVDAKGGFNAHGALGLEVPVRQELCLLLSLGYQFQAAQSTFDHFGWWWGDRQTTQEWRFRRIQLQIGVKF
jgi:hypothetical protein